MSRTYVIAARRSPIVPRNGAFANLLIEDMAKPVILAALADAGLSVSDVGELIVSNALGAGGNPARIIALHSGMPTRVAGLSIDRQCAGGLDSLILADAMIKAGLHQVVVAGGAESYSRRPLRYNTFADGRPPVAYEQARFTPWPDRDPDMAQAADRLAQSHGISKAEQDHWAIESHQKAANADLPALTPVAGVAQDSFTRVLSQRHCERAPVVSGSITAANMAVAADGAAFVVLASEAFVRAHGLDGVAYLGGNTRGADPELPGLAPIGAIQSVLADARILPADLSSAEVMEAFAVQAIACQRGAQLPSSIVNQRGGALARGHPVGASGAVLAAGLYHQLRQTKGYGVAAIAAAGGLGTAVLLRAD